MRNHGDSTSKLTAIILFVQSNLLIYLFFRATSLTAVGNKKIFKKSTGPPSDPTAKYRLRFAIGRRTGRMDLACKALWPVLSSRDGDGQATQEEMAGEPQPPANEEVAVVTDGVEAMTICEPSAANTMEVPESLAVESSLTDSGSFFVTGTSEEVKELVVEGEPSILDVNSAAQGENTEQFAPMITDELQGEQPEKLEEAKEDVNLLFSEVLVHDDAEEEEIDIPRVVNKTPAIEFRLSAVPKEVLQLTGEKFLSFL
jgi:hypothetical protein